MFNLNVKRKVFVSYHHGNDQGYADSVKQLASDYEIFTDCSLDRAINSDNTDYVQWAINEKNLKGTSVTIVLCGAETYKRKYVDWEIYHTLERGHGLLGLKLPDTSLGSQGGILVPDRFYDNYSSSYAVWSTDWSNPSVLKSLIEQAYNNSQNFSRLLNNSREKMTRNN